MRSLLLVLFTLAMILPMQANAASDKKEDSDAKEYVKLDPLLLPIIDDDGVQQVVSMVVAIEVDGVFDADKVKAMKPKLTDAYIQEMYGALNKHAAFKGGVIQVVMIKDKLNKITHEVMGDDIHTEVLLQVVQQRPI